MEQKGPIKPLDLSKLSEDEILLDGLNSLSLPTEKTIHKKVEKNEETPATEEKGKEKVAEEMPIAEENAAKNNIAPIPSLLNLCSREIILRNLIEDEQPLIDLEKAIKELNETQPDDKKITLDYLSLSKKLLQTPVDKRKEITTACQLAYLIDNKDLTKKTIPDLIGNSLLLEFEQAIQNFNAIQPDDKKITLDYRHLGRTLLRFPKDRRGEIKTVWQLACLMGNPVFIRHVFSNIYHPDLVFNYPFERFNTQLEIGDRVTAYISQLILLSGKRAHFKEDTYARTFKIKLAYRQEKVSLKIDLDQQKFIDYAGFDLSQLCFNKILFFQCKFSNTNFSAVHFKDVRMESCDLSTGNLRAIKGDFFITGGSVNKTLLLNTSITLWVWKSKPLLFGDLDGVDLSVCRDNFFSDWDLTQVTTLNKTILGSSQIVEFYQQGRRDFSNIIITGRLSLYYLQAKLSSCNLTNVAFKNAFLEGPLANVNFSSCDLTTTNFALAKNVESITLENATLGKDQICTLYNKGLRNFKGAKFVGDLSELTLSKDCNLTDVDFTGVTGMPRTTSAPSKATIDPLSLPSLREGSVLLNVQSATLASEKINPTQSHITEGTSTIPARNTTQDDMKTNVPLAPTNDYGPTFFNAPPKTLLLEDIRAQKLLLKARYPQTSTRAFIFRGTIDDTTKTQPLAYLFYNKATHENVLLTVPCGNSSSNTTMRNIEYMLTTLKDLGIFSSSQAQTNNEIAFNILPNTYTTKELSDRNENVAEAFKKDITENLSQIIMPVGEKKSEGHYNWKTLRILPEQKIAQYYNPEPKPTGFWHQLLAFVNRFISTPRYNSSFFVSNQLQASAPSLSFEEKHLDRQSCITDVDSVTTSRIVETLATTPVNKPSLTRQ